MFKDITKTRLINSLFLIGFPIIYIIAYIVISYQKGPYYWTPNQDPDYAYLMDSLNIVNSRSPGIFQHPGTTAQVLGAWVIIGSYSIQSLFNSGLAPINETVLSNPELYLELINYAIIGITAFCLLLLGFVCYRVSQNIFLSLMLQTTPFVMALSIAEHEPSRVAPEGLLFCASQLLATLLVIYLFKPTVERSRWFAISFGIVFGLGLVSKLTFLPMLLFIIVVSGIWQKLLTILATVVTFLIATLPIFDKYANIGNWFIALAIRDEPYGRGEVQLINIETILKNLGRLSQRDSLLIYLTGLLLLGCIGVLVLSKYGKGELKINLEVIHTKRLLLLSSLTAIAVIAQLLLTAKEYYQSRYLMPSIGLAGFIIFLLVQLYLPVILVLGRNLLDRSSLTEFVLAIALALAIALGIYQTYTASRLIVNRSEAFRSDTAQIQVLLKSPEYSSCVLTLSRRASTVPSALHFAQFWTGNQFSDVLTQLYPLALFHNEDNKAYENYSQRVKLEDISEQGQRCVLFQTNPLRGRRAERFGPRQPIEEIFVGKVQALYRIKTN